MARKYQDGQYGQLVKKNQKNKKKKSGNIAQTMSQTASQVRKASKRAVSQGKGTPTYRNNTNSSQIQTSKYQDGQYGQFVKNSRLGQSGAAQRNNNNQSQTQQPARKKQQPKNNRVASTYGELNERVNERNQQRARRQSKSAHRFENATKGTLQQTLGSHATTFYAARNPNEDKYIQSEERRKQQGEKNHSKFSEGQYGQLVKKERSGNVKEREKNLKKASELIDKGNKNIEKSKEGLGKGGRFAVDTYSAMLGMATDAAAGPFSMGSMASRSFGAAYDTAKKEGANDTQAALYSASQAAVETGTEKMFALAKPLKKLYGAGVGDDVAEKLLEKMTKKASTKTGKELAYHGGKTAMAALSEGLEEMVSEGLEPALANQIYANATGTPHSTSAKDILYAGAVGGAMGGILGGGGQAVEYNQGRKIQNVYGNDGLKTMAKKLRDVADEASGRVAVGELINRTIDEGQPVTSVQSRRLYQAAAQQEEADFKRQSVMNTVASNEITKKNYLNPVERDQEGNMLVGETTRQRYDESVQNIVQQVKVSGMDKGMEMPDLQVEQIASAVSAIKTGVAGTNEVNMFLVANPKARTVYETITGEKLPSGNTDTKETLYAKIAANRVESAKLETEAFTDRVKGGMAQDVAKTYEPSGQAAFEQMMDQADIANAVQTQNDITAFDDYYRAGRNGIAYETVARMNNPAHQASSSLVRQAAWEAGANDAVLAADTAKGVQMEIGKKISQNRSKGKSGAHGGKVISELSQEAKRNLPASRQRMFRQLARVFNVNIHIVDEAGFNGKYEDGEVYLSVQGDRDISYIFSHEITHHMQEFAPVEYNELKELVRQAWAEKGGIDEAVNDKIAQYAENDVQLTYEDALDEIIADSTYEMIRDEGFAEQMCSENGSLAQKILDAIKNVLSKLRQVLAEGDGFTPAQNAALLSQLDILKDAEKLWTDGLVKAAENRDAVGVKESGKDSYSLRQFEDGRRFVEIDGDTSMFDDLTKREQGALATSIIKKSFAGKVIGVDNRVFVNGRGAGEYGFPVKKLGDVEHDAKMRASTELDNVVDAGFDFRNEPDGSDGHVHKDVIGGFDYFDAIFKIGDRYFQGTINIKNIAKGKLFKDLTKIKDVTEDISSSYGENPKSTFLRTSSNNSIPQTSKKDNEKFSLKEPVEERGNLIAVHNIKESELMKTFKLGGFPMPSIAIVDGKSSFSEYGPISVLFSKDTIDPERSADNEVYSGDAWTPVYPTVEFKVSEKAADRIYQKVREIEKNNVPEGVRRLLNHFNPANIEDEMNRYKGEAGLFETYQNDIDMKNVYLADKGEAVFDVYEKTEKHFAPEELSEIKKYIKELGGEEAARHASREEWVKAVRKIKGITEEEKVPGPVAFRAKNRTCKYLDTGESWTEEKYDYDATVRAIEEKTNQGEYESWLKDFFAGLEEKSGIRNNRDMFDDMGNRRSFDELHYEETLENVVGTMRQEENGGAIFAGQNIWSAATRKYEDIEDIKNDSDRLVAADQEEYDKLRNEYTERLMDITSDIMDHDTDNEFMARDNAAECVAEAVRYSTDPDEIYDYLQDFPQLTVTEENAEDIAELIEDISEMPTEYFEAKPRRAVGFDEVKAVVVPSDTTKELRAALDDAGIEATEYEAGNDEDRIAKVNEVADQKRVKFSLKDSDGRELSKAQQEYFRDSKVRDEDGNLLVMYHGTPKGDFTVFRDGSYFTQNKRYADGYQNETAGRTELDPKTYEVYLNITKPFDIRNDEEARNIYINDYIKGGNAVGINPYMSDAEYDKIDTIDWTEGDDLKDFLIEEEYDYDGLVLDEGADGGYGEDVVYRGDSYVIFSPGQVKNVDNENPTSDSDIRYSLPDEESIMDYAADRETEFAEVPPVRDYERRARGTKQQTYNELRAQVDKLKADKKLTRGRVLDKKSVKEQINDMVVMLKSYGDPDGKKTDHKLVNAATKNIAGIFRYMKEGDYAGAVNQAYNSAQDMIDGLHLVDDSMFREYKELRDLMRTTKISISEEDAANIPDFKDWKKSQFGRLRIGSDGMSVDTFYQVLAEKYPELFDHSISHPADQLQVMADVRESMEPFDILLDSEERSDLIKQAAQDMIDIAATGKPWKSWADRKKETYDEQVKRLKQRQKEALRDAVNTQKERSEKKLRQERQKWKERQQKEAEKHKEKLAAEKEKHKSKEQKQKYNRERKEIKEKIGKTHKWLSDRLLKPTDDKHIPEDFRKQVASILVSLDMQTERSKDLELKYGVSKATMKLHALKARYEEIAKEDGTGIFAYDDTLVSDMDSLGNLVEGKSVDQLTNEELSGLHDILKSIQYQIGSYNKWMSGYRNSGIFETANKSINACRKRQEKIKNRGKKYADGKFYERTGLAGLDQSIDYAMMTPGDAFQYFGEGMNEAYGALREGFNKHIENIQTIRNFFDEVFSPYFKKTRLRKRAKPGSEIEDWRNSSTVKEFKVSGGTIQLNTSQIMSLYCLSKRDQAMGHILNSGIVATRVDPVGRIGRKLGKGVSKAIGGKSSVQGSAITVTFDDVEMIKRSLSDGQVEICEKILQFMNETCSVWGNEVSMKLFDYNKFTEPNYFPIKSSDAYIDTKTDGTQQMQSVTSYGFTKGTVVNASNPIVVDDIFNVAADHMNQMSLYNAFAPAMHDFNKIYNYRVVGEGGKHEASVKAALKDAYGFRAGNYIDHFLKDVNNQASNSLDGLTKIVTASLANYKKSTIAANLRVALQQPTAVARAFIMIDPKYFLGGKNSQLPTDEKFFKNMKDMQEHCPIARWKSWGFSQVDMARGIDDIMMNNEWTRLDRFTMEIYGKLDDITWGQIWGAVRKETLDKHPDVKVNSEEFYRICSERASEIYDKTQVVDSVFHRSQIMRNTDTMSKMVSSFMAEPTRTYNMMRTEILTSIDMIKNGESGGQAKLTRAVTVFLFNAALCSVAAAVADAYRRRDPDWDDDDDGSDWSWFEYWQQNAWANFKDNANPLNMIPVLKDFVSYSDGWDAQNMAMQGWAQLFDSFNRLREGEDDTAFSDFTNALGMVTGIPVKNVKREGKMWFEILGIDVSAAEIDGEETTNGEVLLNKAKAFFKKRKSKKDKKKSDDKDLEPVDYAERVADGKEAGKGLSGEEKEDEVWSAVTKNYTNYIKAGDTESLKKMRKAYEAVGGDMDRFDDAMLKKTKEYLKKNIGEGGDAKKLAKYREYLIKEYSYTEAKISNEIIAKSETAKKFQVSLCEADEDTAVNTLSQLIDAGVSYEDFVQLYENRYKAIKPGDYSTGELANPVTGQITSGFGYRNSPGGIGSTNHKGIDIAVPEGTDVAAADGGKVSKVEYNNSRGFYVEISHGNGRVTRYQHLKGWYVQKGDAISKGQIIAASGNTGHSTGPHLHFEVLEGGTPVNPMNYLK